MENNGAQECTGCAVGSYLSQDGTCSACSKNCTVCSTESTCQGCADGFYMVSEGGVDLEICLACSAEQGCLTCVGEAEACSSCLPGFTRTGFKCISEQNIEINFAIDLEYS